MATLNKILVIYNKSERGLTIDDDGDCERASVSVPPKRSVSLNLTKVQFDEHFLDVLTTYNDRGFVRVTLDGTLLSSTDIGSLKYGSSALFGILDGGHA